MNILYLLKTIDSNKLSDLVAAIDAAPIDINLAIWDAIDNGDIEVDGNKDRVKALKEAEEWHSPLLANMIIRVVQHYAKNETNITRGRLDADMKDPTTGDGYKWHEYLMTLQAMIDKGVIIEDIRTVPKTKNRPFHRFVFLCLPENDNEEWNSRQINKWIDNFKPNKVK